MILKGESAEHAQQSEPNDNDDITFNLPPKSTLKATLIVHPNDNDAEGLALELERLRKVNMELVGVLEYIVNSNIRLNGILQGKQALANAKIKEG